MTRKELKAQEKENVGYIKKENKISTSIDRDGSRTIEAKERSCATFCTRSNDTESAIKYFSI